MSDYTTTITIQSKALFAVAQKFIKKSVIWGKNEEFPGPMKKIKKFIFPQSLDLEIYVSKINAIFSIFLEPTVKFSTLALT